MHRYVRTYTSSDSFCKRYLQCTLIFLIIYLNCTSIIYVQQEKDVPRQTCFILRRIFNAGGFNNSSLATHLRARRTSLENDNQTNPVRPGREWKNNQQETKTNGEKHCLPRKWTERKLAQARTV